jgi:hypothetical protein
VDDAFPRSVSQLRAELERLRAELRKRDGEGDRRGALKIIAEMIAIQKDFMARWPWRSESSTTAPPAAKGPKR